MASKSRKCRVNGKMITVLSDARDEVIQSNFFIAKTTYDFAVERLFPLINRLDIQRRIQAESFYRRLEVDILEGCIMPPITIAFVSPVDRKRLPKAEKFINETISHAFVLDGIQRLNTLNRVASQPGFSGGLPLFLNVIICPSRDKLLYRMVTLNNGQKPMSARHQIEMLASEIYNFDQLGIRFTTEKDDSLRVRHRLPSFKKSDIITAYIGFLSNSVSVENSKIIQEKMDELIARQIMDSGIPHSKIEFSDVVKLIARLSQSTRTFEWFKNLNNLLGFCVGCRRSFNDIVNSSVGEFLEAVDKFEEAFSFLDISKIKLGRERRKHSEFFISEFPVVSKMEVNQILLQFNDRE